MFCFLFVFVYFPSNLLFFYCFLFVCLFPLILVFVYLFIYLFIYLFVFVHFKSFVLFQNVGRCQDRARARVRRRKLLSHGRRRARSPRSQTRQQSRKHLTEKIYWKSLLSIIWQIFLIKGTRPKVVLG
jgi:hypothetical protein